MKIIIIGCFSLCITAALSAEELSTNKIVELLDFEKRQKVLDGDVIVAEAPSHKSKGATYRAIGTICKNVSEVSAVLLEFNRYPEFMPNVEKIELPQAQLKGKVLVDYSLGLPLGKKKYYRLQFTYQKTARRFYMSWVMIPRADLKPEVTIVDTTGFWLVEPDPKNKEQTLAVYQVNTDPGDIPWGFGWIVDLLTEDSIPDVIRATRARLKCR